MSYLYSITINVGYCVQYGLDFQHACLIKLFLGMANRAEKMEYEGKLFYRLNTVKIKEQLPMLSQKNDTIYRYIKTLIDKEIIEKVPKLDYYRVTQKGINYDYKSDASEINPIDVGNKSDTPSEINPIYNNTINESINEEDISPSDLVGSHSEIFSIVGEENNPPQTPPADYVPKQITVDIDQVIDTVKNACKKYGTIYGSSPKERQYAKHLMSKKFKSECLDQVSMDLPQFIDAIISLNPMIKYGKIIKNSVDIYYNRSDSINKVKQSQTQKATKQAVYLQ